MKVAVSVPDAIFDAAERMAKQRRVPRSQLFAEALQEYVSRHGSETVAAKLNEIYGAEDSTVEEPLAQGQYASIEHEAWWSLAGFTSEAYWFRAGISAARAHYPINLVPKARPTPVLETPAPPGARVMRSRGRGLSSRNRHP